MTDRARVSAFLMIQSKIIWLVRHGESIGNVARHEAEKCSALLIETPHREPDVRKRARCGPNPSSDARRAAPDCPAWYQSRARSPE